MPTKTLSSMTAEELATELARKQEEQAAQAAERAERLEDARKTWATDTWDAREQRETDLQERGAKAREEFSAAVKAADLHGAFAAWMTERTTRYARESARNRAVTAGRSLGERVDHIPDLRWYHPDFLARLEEEADKAARANGYNLADELVPDAPIEVE